MLTQPRFTTRAKRLLAFFDSDLRGQREGFLEQAYNSGYTLLPLNTSAMTLCNQANVPFSLLDQWISPEVIIEAKGRAEEWERCWSNPAEERLTSGNIFWPSFDKEAMHWFWRDVAVAYAFAESFLECEGRELCYFMKRSPRPALYYYHADVIGALWKKLLPNKAHSIEMLTREGNTSEDGYLAPSPIAFMDENRSPLPSPFPNLAGKIVLALNPGELHRFEPVIRKLGEVFPGDVAAVMIFPNIGQARKFSRAYSIPVLSPMHGGPPNPLLQEQFSQGYQESVALTREKRLRWTLNCLKFHFEYYCGKRWPALASTLQSWLELWGRNPPRAVIVSSLEDAESQLPAEAARRHNIPTFSIPHGGSMTSTPDINVADYILFQFPIHERICNQAPLVAHRMRPCSDLLSVNEYPVAPARIASDTSTWRVLALLNPVGLPDCICPHLMVGSQIDALRILDEPPSEVAGQLELRVKVHPGFPDLELFSFVSSRLQNQVMPTNSDLQTALAEVELILAVNYSGVALMHALRAGKPIAFFWTDPLLEKRISPHQHADLYLPAGCSVCTAEELWSTIRKFFTEEDFAEELRSRAREFARHYLSDAHHPTISEVIREAFCESQPEGFKESSMNSRTLEKRKIDELIPDSSLVPFSLIDYRFDYGEMLLDELITLCRIVRHKQPRIIFEIGTFLGGTTLQLAANSNATLLTLDLPPQGHPDYMAPEIEDPELDVYPSAPGSKYQASVFAPRIRQLFGNSGRFDFTPYHGIVDLVFVDGSHHYEDVLTDSLNALRMIKADGVILWHDYADYASGVVRALNELSGTIPLVHIEGTSLVMHRRQHRHEAGFPFGRQGQGT